VVERDAFADLLSLDGNPLANGKLPENPAKNLLVIMKGGNTCDQTYGICCNGCGSC
jgi:hypothetical protein